MILADPEGRRGLRSIIQGVIAIACLAGLWWLISLLRTDREGLILIAKGALVLLGIGTVGYQFENGMRAFKLTAGAGGVTIEGEADAAQAVADSAQQTADVIKDDARGS